MTQAHQTRQLWVDNFLIPVDKKKKPLLFLNELWNSNDGNLLMNLVGKTVKHGVYFNVIQLS